MEQETNPIRAIKKRITSYLKSREEFYDKDPLGQKIAKFYGEWKELVAEVRKRVRARIAAYVKKLQEE
uniref:Hydrophobic ligand binding protein n=1 Tax=Moniezia expansa TaxID=28841 RepID=Q9GPP5_MONEX|nr:hydrophobic ligand binding protein [Moniezia expansa]